MVKKVHYEPWHLLGRMTAIVFTIWFLSKILFGCSTIYPMPALTDQILHVRDTFHGLETQNCARKLFGECKEMNKLTYDLKSPETRAILRDNLFVCKIGATRFRIAKDQSGFVSDTYSGALWWKKKTEKYLDIDKDFNLLVAEQTVCVSENSANDQFIF